MTSEGILHDALVISGFLVPSTRIVDCEEPFTHPVDDSTSRISTGLADFGYAVPPGFIWLFRV